MNFLVSENGDEKNKICQNKEAFFKEQNRDNQYGNYYTKNIMKLL